MCASIQDVLKLAILRYTKQKMTDSWQFGLNKLWLELTLSQQSNVPSNYSTETSDRFQLHNMQTVAEFGVRTEIDKKNINFLYLE